MLLVVMYTFLSRHKMRTSNAVTVIELLILTDNLAPLHGIECRLCQ